MVNVLTVAKALSYRKTMVYMLECPRPCPDIRKPKKEHNTQLDNRALEHTIAKGPEAQRAPNKQLEILWEPNRLG